MVNVQQANLSVCAVTLPPFLYLSLSHLHIWESGVILCPYGCTITKPVVLIAIPKCLVFLRIPSLARQPQSGGTVQSHEVSLARCMQQLHNNRFRCACAARFCWLRGACLPICVCKKRFEAEIHQLVTCFVYLHYFCVFQLGISDVHNTQMTLRYTQTHEHIFNRQKHTIHTHWAKRLLAQQICISCTAFLISMAYK